MMSLQSSMHSSQMKTDGPAMSLRTSCWLLPQNEQYSSLSPVDLSAIQMYASQICRFTLRGSDPFLQDLVDDSVFLGSLGPQEIVTVVVALHLVLRASGEFRHQRDESLLEIDHELRMAFHVGHLPLESARRLMNHDRGI